jgi:beta-glucosidase
MPVTYPLAPNGYTTYDYKPMEVRLGNTYDRLYPFGWGLSYTTFEYSNLNLSTRVLQAPNDLTVSVDVTNSGAREGMEAVLLYINDVYGCVSRPNRQLRGAQKISLEPKETQTVTFTLTMHDLSFINAKNQRIVEAGNFNVYVGSSNGTFTLQLTTPTTPTAQPVTTTPSSAVKPVSFVQMPIVALTVVLVVLKNSIF